MTEENEDLLITGALLVAGALVVKSVLNTIGVSAEDTQTVNDALSDDPSENPFSFQFSYYVNLYTPRYGGLSMQQYWQGVKAGNPNDQIAVWAETVYNAIGFWQTIDENAVTGVFNAVSAQVDVAAIDAYLYSNYSVDLLSFLRSGQRYLLMFKWGLTDTITAQIINRVNGLPAQLQSS